MDSWRQWGQGSGQGGGNPVCLDDFRQYHESDKQWEARKQFLGRHIHLYPGRKMDQLIALSVVWSNIVFIGNRYGEQLTQKVHQMGEGIDIGEMPSYELVPGAKATKRPGSADVGDQPQKKIASKFGPRPRFEPVHFVVSTLKEDNCFQKTNEPDCQTPNQYEDCQTPNQYEDCQTPNQYEDCQTPHQYEDCQTPNQYETPEICVTTSDTSDHEENAEMDSLHSDAMDDQSRSDYGNFMAKMEQNYSAKFESHCSTLGKDFRHNVLDMWKGVNKQGRKGIGFVKPPKTQGKFSKDREKVQSTSSGRTSETLDKPAFIQQLSAVVSQNMLNPKMNTDANRINYTYMLTRSIQACKTNPEYIYVSLKEIPPSDLPKRRKFPVDGYACEVRCQDVYLATGYSGSKNGARDRAAEQAILLLQKKVEVIKVKRKCGQGFREDLVAYPVDTPKREFPPSLKQEDSHSNETSPSSQCFDPTKGTASTKSWSDFILTENACDAIGILNNSATFNKMTVEYKYTMMPCNTWRCSVYVQDHCVAEGYGNKKNSKHEAAKEAVNIFKKLQPNLQKASYVQPTSGGLIKELKDIVVYENASNPVCTLNDTAQFNKVTVEYIFERLTGLNWKCKVFMERQFIAEAIGIKKTVKHDAAQAAVTVLKKTQPVVVNNLKKGSVEDGISRNQIRGCSSEEAYKKQIKEDNIGNQLLRKMGWTGGGLGKEGGGISEPIFVKEQYSREGLGLLSSGQKLNKRDIEQIIRNYAASYNQDDLTFSRELTNEERKHIHQIAQKYRLKSKSHGQGNERFLVVSRKRSKDDLIHQLRQEGQVGSYALVMPQQN
ncbi:NF-kappa-B-repressing factor [Rhinophrynus dorsalis]